LHGAPSSGAFAPSNQTWTYNTFLQPVQSAATSLTGMPRWSVTNSYLAFNNGNVTGQALDATGVAKTGKRA
jgi:hypothetical protein